MRILIVTFTFPPNKDGVAEAASAMAEGFAANGWRVEILTEALPQPRGPNDPSGIQIHEFTCSSGKNHDILIHGEIASYAEFLRSPVWDVIVFHAYSMPFWKALPLLDGIPAKKIFVSHGYNGLIWERVTDFPYGIPSLFRRFFRSLSMFRWIHRFDRVVYLSETADFRAFYDHWIAKKAGYAGRRIIPNGVKLDELGKHPATFRQQHGIPATSFMLLCVANYSPRKDQGFAVRAFREAAIPDSVLVFIGSQFNEHSDLFREADRLRAGSGAPGRIVWLENQTREATLDALAACDAFLLSASHEAQPIVLLEAMREAKPWIARDAGCIASLEGGICVGTEFDMTMAMLRLNEHPSLRLALGKEGRTAVESHYNRQNYTGAHISLVNELIASASGS